MAKKVSSPIATTAILSRKEKVSRSSGDGCSYGVNCYHAFEHLDETVYEVISNTSGITDYIGKETKIYYDKNYPENTYCLSSDKFGNYFLKV